MKRLGVRLFGLIAAIGMVVMPVSGMAGAQSLTKITLQLKWVDQAQFGGYYAAVDQGFYKAQGLDVTLLPGGPSVTPEQVVAGGKANFGLDWLPSLLATREQGANIVNIAQVFARSGMREVSFKSK